MPEIISAEDITVSLNGKEIIRGLSFSIRNGEVLAVVGPNGSGKTTLLRALLGIIPLRGGRVRFFGRERPVGPDAEDLIAYIPQRIEMDRTFPLSVREMLRLSTRREPHDKYIGMLGLEGLLSLKVGDLSGGQMQRALLAYAIVKEPKILIMDEPTSWVDTEGADCVLCIMDEFRKKGIAMIIVSHDFSALKRSVTHVLGLGHEGHFFEPAESDRAEDMLASLFRVSHHAGKACFMAHGGKAADLPGETGKEGS